MDCGAAELPDALHGAGEGAQAEVVGRGGVAVAEPQRERAEARPVLGEQPAGALLWADSEFFGEVHRGFRGRGDFAPSILLDAATDEKGCTFAKKAIRRRGGVVTPPRRRNRWLRFRFHRARFLCKLHLWKRMK